MLQHEVIIKLRDVLLAKSRACANSLSNLPEAGVRLHELSGGLVLGHVQGIIRDSAVRRYERPYPSRVSEKYLQSSADSARVLRISSTVCSTKSSKETKSLQAPTGHGQAMGLEVPVGEA